MAQGDNIIIDVLGNTRPLEREIQRVANTTFNLNSKGFSQPLGKINGQLGEFEKSLAASNARVIAFGASAGAIFAVQRAFSETVRSVIDVEKALTDINVILNVSSKNLANFGNSLFDIAKNTGQSFAQVASAATEFSRQGLGLEETLKRTSDALVLTRLTGLDVVASVESITAALNSFNQTTITSNELINKLAAVDAAFAVSSADLAEAIKRVGSTAQDVGVDINQLIALVTSAQQITARGGAVIGNSFKTIFTRLQRTDTLDALEAIGVQTKDQEGNILPLINILSSLSASYSKLNDVQRAQVAELVGGVFQINILKAALSDLGNEYSIYSRAVSISNTATNEANSRNEELNQTLNATINKTFANLQKLAAEVGNITIAPTLKNLLGGLNNILEGFDPSKSEDIGSRIGQGLLKGIGDFISGPGVLLAAATLFKVFERLISFSADAFKSLTGINGKIAEQQALQGQILNLISKNPQIVEQINSGTANTASLHREILKLIEQETASMQKQISMASNLARSLSSAGVSISTSGLTKGMPIKNKNKYQGFIPNFNKNSDEIFGAISSGYKPGKIKQMNIPQYGMVTYNGAEKVKKFVGFNQPAIMPPEGSMAGKNYRKNFEKTHGFDPYSYNGFIPNFALPKPPPGTLTNLKGAQIATLAKGGSINLPLGEKYTPNAEQRLYYSQLQESRKRPDAKNPRGKKVISVLGEAFNVLNASNSDFDQLAGKELAKAIQSIAFKLIKPSTKKLPAASTILNQLQEDTSAYPQIMGRLFESAINAAIQLDLSKKIGGGGGVWDYSGSNFISDDVNTALFGGQLAAMQALPYLDAKLNASSRDTTESVRGKIKNTPALKESIIKAVKNNEKLVKLPYGIIKSKGDLKPITFRDQDLAYNGFIPNFASLKEAVGRELSAGVPASTIRIGKSNYLKNRDNPEGLGVYNTEDEPKGLNQGIERYRTKKNAQKAGKYNGYIPNFALAEQPKITYKPAPVDFDARLASVIKNVETSFNQASTQMKSLSQKVSKVKVYFDERELSRPIQKYKSSLIQSSIAISLAGGLLQEAFKESPKIAKAVEQFSTTLSLAGTAIQLIPGKAGLAAGAFVGLAGAATILENILTKQSIGLQENAEKASQNLTDFSDSSQKYAETLQKLEQARKNPLTPSDTIIKLNQSLVTAAGALPSAYREQLVAVQNYTDLLDEISKIQSKLTQEEKYAKGAAEFGGVLDKRTGNEFAKFLQSINLKQITNPREAIGGGLEGQLLRSFEIEKYAKQFAETGFEDLDKRAQLIRKLYSGEAPVIGGKAIQKSLAANPEQLADLGFRKQLIDEIKRISETGGAQGQMFAETFIQAILNELLAGEVGKKETEIQVKEREKERDIIIKQNQEREREIQLQKQAQNAINNFYEKLIKFGDIDKEYKQKVSLDDRDIQLQRASGLLNLNKGRLGEQSSREIDYAISQAQREITYQRQLMEQQTSARTGVIGVGYDVLMDLKKLNVPGETPKVDEKILNEFQRKLADLAISGKSPENIGQEILNVFNSYFGGTEYGSKALDIQNRSTDILAESQKSLIEIVTEQRKGNEIAKINNEIQKAAIQRQKDVRAFGGLESYISPESNTLIESLITNIRGLSTPVGGRASAGLLLDTVKMFGGSLEGVNLGSLKERAIAGRAEDIRFQTSAIARLLTGKGEIGLAEEYRKIGGRSNEIARTQVEEAIQDQKALRNIDTNVSTITSLIPSIVQNINSNQNQGFYGNTSFTPNQQLTPPAASANQGDLSSQMNILSQNIIDLNANMNNINSTIAQANQSMQQMSVKGEVKLSNSDLSLNGNVAVNINSEPIEFSINTDSIENIKEDLNEQISVSIESLRRDLESQLKTVQESINSRIVELGGKRLPPSK